MEIVMDSPSNDTKKWALFGFPNCCESGGENPRESTLLGQLVLEANIPVRLWLPSKGIPLVVLGNVEGCVKNIQEHGYWRKTGARPMKKFLDIALDIYEGWLGTT